jgi:hypothetical protein
MIQETDILKVAKELEMKVSKKKVKKILKDYPNRAKNNPKDNWSYIVEDALYE